MARVRSVKAKTFKEAADVLGTSPSTIIRRLKELIKTMPNGVQLPEVITIEEYKADTHKDKSKLTKDELWYLERYTSMSLEWKEAYELKELYKKWQRDSKEEKDCTIVKAGLLAFYRKVKETQIQRFLKRLRRLKIGKLKSRIVMYLAIRMDF